MISAYNMVSMSLSHFRGISYSAHVFKDVIIIEDDPYYFLQLKEYRLPSERATSSASKHDSAAFIASLEPSYLK